MSTDIKKIRPGQKLIPEGFSADDELLSYRGLHRKVFSTGKYKYKAMISPSPVHYKDDFSDNEEQFKDIDLAVGVSGHVESSLYKIDINKAGIGYTYTGRNGGSVDVSLVKVGGAAVDNSKLIVSREGNEITWTGLHAELAITLELFSHRVELWKRLSGLNAPRSFTWNVKEYPGSCGFDLKVKGWDSNSNKKSRTEHVTETKEIRRTAEYTEFDFTETWTGRVGLIANPKDRVKVWDDKPVYPVTIDVGTGQIDIAATNDDGYVSGGGGWANTSVYAGIWSGIGPNPDGNAGFRFVSIPIPQGATINTATLRINLTALTGSPSFNIAINEITNAPAFSNGNLPGTFGTSYGAVAWTPGGTGWFSLSVDALIQQVVSLGGWSSNNAIAFAVKGVQTAGSHYVAAADVESSANEATIEVDYTVGGGGLSIPLAMHHYTKNIGG